MMNSNAERGAVFGAEETGKTRFDLSNLLIQRYGDTAIASYTLLISTALGTGVTVAAHNESRVMVKLDGTLESCACSQVARVCCAACGVNGRCDNRPQTIDGGR
jgi:hypothetical protein